MHRGLGVGEGWSEGVGGPGWSDVVWHVILFVGVSTCMPLMSDTTSHPQGPRLGPCKRLEYLTGSSDAECGVSMLLF